MDEKMSDYIDDFKKYEFDKAWESMRYFLEYRLKFFNFFIASNGVLLTVVLAHLKNNDFRIVLALFAVLVSIIMSLIDKRITYLAQKYRAIVVKISNELCLNNIHSLHSNDETRFTLHNLFLLLYIIIVIMWILLIVLIKFKLFTVEIGIVA